MNLHSQARSTYGATVWSWVALAYFVVVVLGGAIVRTSGAGAGCGDRWPLCNGQWVPHHPRLVTIIEFTHRSTTFVAVLLFAIMIGWTFRATTEGHWARRAASWTALLLVTESVLGAVLVLRHLVVQNTSLERVVVQSIHFTNTMLLLGAATLTPVFLSLRESSGEAESGLRTISIATVVLTILTGAAGSLAALADTLYPYPTLASAIHADFDPASPALLHLRWLHPASALMLGVLCGVLMVRYVRAGRRGAAVGLGLIFFLQVALGLADVLLLAPVWCQLLHLLAADVFWIGLVAATAPDLFRRQAPSVSRRLIPVSGHSRI